MFKKNRKSSLIVGIMSVFCGCSLAMFLMLIDTRPVNSISTYSTTATATQPPGSKFDEVNALVNDEDCTLPCWWGLTLGETTLVVTLDFYDNRYDDYSVEIRDGYVILDGQMETYPENTYDLYAAYFYHRSVIHAETNRLAFIEIIMWFPDLHHVDWSPLSITNSLRRYGPPDEISFQNNELSPRIDVTLRFRSLGFYARYHKVDFFHTADNLYEICGALEHVKVNMWLWLVADGFYEPGIFVGLDQIHNGVQYERAIEDITSINAEEFTEQIIMNDGCTNPIDFGEWFVSED